MKIIKNREKIGNTNVIDIKSHNQIDLFVNIAKNATNFFIFNKKDQLKEQKKC